MEGNNWRPAASQGETAVDSASEDWRSQLHPDARQRNVNKIMEILKRHLPISVPEGISELKKIAIRFEEKIYTAATNQSDYLRRISVKMLSMESKTQGTVATNSSPSNLGVANSNPAYSASMDSTVHTGHTGAGDWQEEIYQKIKSMEELYFVEISEMNQKISSKFQQQEALPPSGKLSEQLERMKQFKSMLERILALLQIPKCSIQPSLKEKLPQYEKQIITFIQNKNRKDVLLHQQGQQQLKNLSGHAHSMTQQQSSQLSQLQLHDNLINQDQEINLQGSMAIG